MKFLIRLIRNAFVAFYRNLKWYLSAISAGMSSLFVAYLELNA